MVLVCPAAAPENVRVRQHAGQLGLIVAEFLGVTAIQFGCRVEFSVTFAGSVGTETPDSLLPGTTPIQDMFEIIRVGAIAHAVQRGDIRCRIDPDYCIATSSQFQVDLTRSHIVCLS
jgi:hypothetical protein